MNHRIHITLLVSIFSFHFLAAQTSIELQPSSTIKVIGTAECVDYDNNNQMSRTVNTAVNLFDNNMNTIFATYQRSGGWAGLDLGTKHVITKVAFAVDIANRALLAVFEGANSADFSDAIPILIVKEAVQTHTLIEADINCSRGFRYVRFIGPNDSRCKSLELKFFGYESSGDDSELYRVTNLPTVTIQTKNAQDITSKEHYITGKISIISEDQIHTDEMEIRGRGNASWGFAKKPYRFKLNKKARLLGLPANAKSWTLINNWGDKTLMRNLLAFDLSKRLELAYTPAGTPVDVILNGEYKGCYQLCDQIQINPGRVEIEEMIPADVNDPYNITGGYLIEVDAYAYSEAESEWFTSRNWSIPINIGKSLPDDITMLQNFYFKNYIQNHFNLFEEALLSSAYKNLETGYRKYLDLPSFLRHFIVGEFSGNTDTYWSVYMYKRRGEDKFYVGPVWDFDLAYDNDSRTYPVNNRSGWVYNSGGSSANNMNNAVNRILGDQAADDELRYIYTYYRDRQIITEKKLIEVINNYENQMYESQRLNFIRWDIMNRHEHLNPVVWGSYSAEVENVRRYTRERIAWMDRKFNYTPLSIEDKKQANFIVHSEKNTLFVQGISGLSQILIYDMGGRLISQEQITGNYIKSLPQGTYIINIIPKETGVKEIHKCLVL